MNSCFGEVDKQDCLQIRYVLGDRPFEAPGSFNPKTETGFRGTLRESTRKLDLPNNFPKTRRCVANSDPSERPMKSPSGYIATNFSNTPIQNPTRGRGNTRNVDYFVLRFIDFRWRTVQSLKSPVCRNQFAGQIKSFLPIGLSPT